MASVLIVERDRRFRQVLRRALEKAGHSAGEAASAEQALSESSLLEPDLIVAELGLEEREGLSLLPELVRRWQGVRVIAMTAALESDDHPDTAKAVGAERLLRKPFTLHDFLCAVEAALEQR